VQLLRNLAQVLGLVVPVDAHRREVARLEQHSGMAAEYFLGIGGVVFFLYLAPNFAPCQVVRWAPPMLQRSPRRPPPPPHTAAPAYSCPNGIRFTPSPPTTPPQSVL